MNANLASSATAGPVPQMARGLILLFAFSCGAIVANLYYAQPIIALIAPDLHMSGGMASLIVSLTQIGYAAGLFFLVPLGDLVENKKLMVVTALMSIASLALAATVRAPGLFLAVSLIVGFSSVAVQLLIPLAAHLAPSESRGRVVGTIMSGLLLGILLSRPVASFIADHFGWRAVFAFGAATMAVVTVLLMLTVPSRRPAHQATYMQLIRSLGRLVATQPVLRERSLYQGLMFGSFSLFWSAAPVELMHHHHLSQSAIALFSLVGAMGASSAPIAGRLADAGHTGRATVVALGLAAASFAPALFVPGAGVAGLVATGILLDFAVQMNMVLGQREIYALDAHSRNRLNSIYMTSIFVGGAIGSALASALYEHGGWTWIATVGALFPLAALARFAFASRAAR
ncbi:major facilitator family transporter [Burkholderia pseudomallei]|uniref:MFS transporter n=1 Tax=Burkholderia pseudomallei TaxID=28450 RepID=UPI0009761DAA|nr:MFS transporter [Burkholderia pseudomallei]OMS61092.1 MFS transporter [Burkholderia pseudomallei]CAJ3277773.1 major facilitator family transporter [Burkholderia pseudomallei]CAJ4252366.1 major facilitator family transporter [Burkholderia pseudomallei]CAJ4779852.1 major facilitator family transporter [Burkholderia pseudomallei]CAJ5420055.1 major facilitator family transporter [Burkholderia pseudomallei]